MNYLCTDFSVTENWSFGENRLTHTFQALSTVTIGYSSCCWIAPFSSRWNIATTFSTLIRNDTGRINSSPRAITAPVIRIQQGCNATIQIPVNDPDGDIIRCRLAQGSECAGVCDRFLAAVLDPVSCSLSYDATKQSLPTGFQAAAIMIEDFIPGSVMPLSSVALQFLVLVVSSDEQCSAIPKFISSTITQGTCVAIPPGETFNTSLLASSGSVDALITEIQTVSPVGLRRSELFRVGESGEIYGINITWTPRIDQQNETHLFCYTAVNSFGVTSPQVCIQLQAGAFPPTPIQETAMPRQQAVHPTMTIWSITFNTKIERPFSSAFITFHELDTGLEVYRIDASLTAEVSFEVNQISIKPLYSFEEQQDFYINFDGGIVAALEGCMPENYPVDSNSFWTFQTLDVTPPNIVFLVSLPDLTNDSNIFSTWVSSEAVMWNCTLMDSTTELEINCSDGIWMGNNLTEGEKQLLIQATDEAGNTAQVIRVFRVDTQPPVASFRHTPTAISNEMRAFFQHDCNEVCSFRCTFTLIQEIPEPVVLLPCGNRNFFTSPLLHNRTYRFHLRPMDRAGNIGELITYTWGTDFERPNLFGVRNTSVSCTNRTSPAYTGQAQATDNRPEQPVITYTDVQTPCFIRRTWNVVDVAGNTNNLIQHIILDFSPSFSLLPIVSLQCDSSIDDTRIPETTVALPNPCQRPLQLTFIDSVNPSLCPGEFNRTWTAVDVCSQLRYSEIQTIRRFDVCPPLACGRSESPPRGMCIGGSCTCNQPWFGKNCSHQIFQPILDPVNDSLLEESEEYSESIMLLQGTPPLTWTLLIGPSRLELNQLTGEVTWRRAQAGNHSIIVRIVNQVGMATVRWTIMVRAGYNASLNAVNPSIYARAQPVLLSGNVQYMNENAVQNSLARFVPVHIDVSSNNVIRVLKVFTQADGSFSTSYFPAATEIGAYTAGARHPSSSKASVQTQWGFLGMRATPQTLSLSGETVAAFEGTFCNITVVTNIGPATLSGLTAVVDLGNLQGLTVQPVLNAPSTFNTGDSVSIDLIIRSTQPINVLFPIELGTTEGTTLQLSVNLQIAQILPCFRVTPSSVTRRVLRGSSNFFNFNVTNIGRIAAHNVRTLLPMTNLLSIVSFGNTQQLSEGALTLAIGESVILSILLRIPPTQQLGNIKGDIIIANTDTFKRVSLDFTVSSNTLLNVTVRVEDEYSYFAVGRPLVSDAAVRLVNYERIIRITQTTEEGNGTTTFIGIPEDHYELFVEAPGHQSITNVFVLSPENPVITVFLARQAIAYRWSVTPVPFEDTYNIVIEADFEVQVPIPVVTVSPNDILLKDFELGLEDTIQLNITNHGLIRANNVLINLQIDHPFLEFSISMNNFGDLEPLSSIIVPVHVSRVNRTRRNIIWVTYAFQITYNYVCDVLQTRGTSVLLRRQEFRPESRGLVVIVPSSGSCCGTGSGGPSQGRPGQAAQGRLGQGRGQPGQGLPASGFQFSGYAVTTPNLCDPCIQAIVNCIPTPKFPFSGCIPMIVGGGGVKDVIDVLSWINCGLDSTQLISVSNRKFRNQRVSALQKRLGIGTCFASLIRDCVIRGGVLKRSVRSSVKRSVRSSVNELVEGMLPLLSGISFGIEVLGDERWMTTEAPLWLSSVLRPALADNSEMGVLVSSTELSAILGVPPPSGTTTEIVAILVERLNNTLHGWNSGQLEPQDGSNMASFSRVGEFVNYINIYNDVAVGKGFPSYLEAYNFAAAEVNKIESWEDVEGVCAVVRIRIEQQIAVTREAFLASLEIENKEQVNLESITLEIRIVDFTTGEITTHRFSISNATLSGRLVNADGSTWSLASGASGAAEWLIIPLSEAAPMSNTDYDVGGTLSYFLNSVEIIVPLLPTRITVIPDPSLVVHYFWERFVVGDDPFTNETEPSMPFVLGVAVRNAGFGTAGNVRITSAQPEIIENEKGLLVNFRIISANIGNSAIIPSLSVDFGDITPNTTMVARWQILSSLQGMFMNYSATFESNNPLGDPRLSILDVLEIHELIRSVHIYTDDENDGILDFLTNDRNDLLAFPDALYSSMTLRSFSVAAGEVTLVMRREMDGSQFLDIMTTSNSSGWVYYRYEDTKGFLSSPASALLTIKTEAGQSMTLPPENAWISREQRPLPGMSRRIYLHIVDHIQEAGEVEFSVNICTSNCTPEERQFDLEVVSPSEHFFCTEGIITCLVHLLKCLYIHY